MATTKPRITITLTPRQYELLRSISDSSGQSMSAFLGEMLEGMEPVLERMAATFQRLKQHKDAHREKILVHLDEAQSALEPLAASVLGQFDLFLGQVEEVAADRGVSATADTSAETSTRGKRRGSPRAVITGATPPQPPTPGRSGKTRKPATSKAKTKGRA